MTLDIENAPSDEEIRAGKQIARARVRSWMKRSLYAVIVLFLSCAAVSFFLYGHPLHAYWDSFGKYLILLSMALLLVAVYCVAMWWGSWTILRDLEKTYS
jgi:succinate dehydrogenase hydrophobic anchor subunit